NQVSSVECLSLIAASVVVTSAAVAPSQGIVLGPSSSRMRKVAIAIVVAAVWAGCLLLTQAKFEDSCMACMCWASTNCSYDREQPCVTHEWGEYCGPFAITFNYWIDGGCRHVDDVDKPSIDCTLPPYYECVGSDNCNQMTVQAYLEKYVTSAHPKADCELYAKTHSGGPWGINQPYALEYWNAVSECCVNITETFGQTESICDTKQAPFKIY
ncbi:unnamed protein product, partial [Meganyctiphanes norvegica]